MQSGAYSPGRGAAQPAGAFHKLRFLDSKDLRYIHYARLRKVGLAFLQKHVARCVRPAQIRGDQAHDARCNCAAVENIVLDHDAGMPIRGCRTSRGPEVKPIYLSLPNLAHQRSLTVRRILALIPFTRRLSTGSAA